MLLEDIALEQTFWTRWTSRLLSDLKISHRPW